MRRGSSCGYSLIEVMVVSGLIATAAGVAIPQLLTALDDLRTVGAARYMSARLHRARMEAVMRSADVALRFTADARGYTFATYVDSNRNGVLTTDIQGGIDRSLAQAERLSDNFAGVEFGTLPLLPPVDSGGTPPADNPIRVGPGGLVTFGPLGTSTSGSLYIRGRRNAQYAVRIFGETGKIRVLRFDTRARQW
jgi:prepilin-type N-terminal cleavage/methylation domain-containing protein